MAFANEAFGFVGEAFVAQIGPNVPAPPEQGIVGQNIVRVNAKNGTVAEFLTLKTPITSFKPTDVLFLEADNSMAVLYIVDWGVDIHGPTSLRNAELLSYRNFLAVGNLLTLAYPTLIGVRDHRARYFVKNLEEHIQLQSFIGASLDLV